MAYMGGGGSFFQAVSAREVLGSRVFQRPNLRDLNSNGATCGCGVLEVESNGLTVPALALTFGKGHDNGHLLAVADEEGFLSIFNVREHLPSLAACHHETEDVRIGRLLAHNNAVFDICWLQDAVNMLTASGDQLIKLWDMNLLKNKETMTGHDGTVKSLSVHPFHERQFISGSRDGNVAIWDLRCQGASRGSGSESSSRPMTWIKDAHIPPRRRKRQSFKSTTKSVTAVLYLKDGQLIATAGAADGKVKFWDLRNVREPVHQSLPGESKFQDRAEGRRAHGISSLAQDPAGTNLIASSTDDRIYMYHLTHPNEPVKIFTGHMVRSFYVKAVFSPDGSHILSGSTDGDVFIWQVDKEKNSPTTIKSHEGEVTAVDWCPTDFCKLATCSDDHTVRVWSIENPCFTQQFHSAIGHHTKTLPFNKRLVAPSLAETSVASYGKEESPLDFSMSEKPFSKHIKQKFLEDKQLKNGENCMDSTFAVSKRQKSISHYFASLDLQSSAV